MSNLPVLPVTFQSSKLKMLLLFGISSVFVTVGAFLIGEEPVISWLCIVFFGLCGLIGLVNLHPRASYLTLTEKGFEFASLFRRHFTPWTDVAQFFPSMIALNQMVGWDYVAGYARAAQLRKANLALGGCEAALPDTYGHKAEELASIMDELRQKYAR